MKKRLHSIYEALALCEYVKKNIAERGMQALAELTNMLDDRVYTIQESNGAIIQAYTLAEAAAYYTHEYVSRYACLGDEDYPNIDKIYFIDEYDSEVYLPDSTVVAFEADVQGRIKVENKETDSDKKGA